jgi:tetratricopeptide (TPR) repeat protein
MLVAVAGALLVAACSDSGSSGQPTPTTEPLPTPIIAATATPSPLPEPSPTPSPEPDPSPTPEIQALFEYMRAVNLLEAAQYEDAIPAYGLVIRKLPDLAIAYNGRGLAYYHEERLALALEDFSKAIELKSGYADAYANRAVVHRDQGDTEKATADLEKAIEL